MFEFDEWIEDVCQTRWMTFRTAYLLSFPRRRWYDKDLSDRTDGLEKGGVGCFISSLMKEITSLSLSLHCTARQRVFFK